MDVNRTVKRNLNFGSCDDEPDVLESPVELQTDPTAADSAANSSVGQQSNSPMTQVEVDNLLGQISLEDLIRENEDFRAAKVSDSLEILRLKEELGEKNEILKETRLKLTQCESDRSQFAMKLGRLRLDAQRGRDTIDRLKEKIDTMSSENYHLRADCLSLKAELRQQDEDLRDAEALKTQISQLYTVESAKLKSVEQQFEAEKEKNRQKDQQLAEHQNELIGKSTEIVSKSGEILNLRQAESRQKDQMLLELQIELTEKSAENHSKSAEILKLRQNAQSLRVGLASKSEDFLWLKSQVKTALEEELNCAVCKLPMTEAIVLTKCGHTFCKSCIDRCINEGHQTCPLCRSESLQFAPVVTISQLQAKLLSCVNGERPIVTRPNDENLPSGDNNTSAQL